MGNPEFWFAPSARWFPGPGVEELPAGGRGAAFYRCWRSHLLAVRPSVGPAYGRQCATADRFQDSPADSTSSNITQVLRGTCSFLVDFKKGLITVGGKMKRSHRVALKPTPEQESLFDQHAGYARFAYKWAVGERSRLGKSGRWRMAARPDVAAALQCGQGRHRAVGQRCCPRTQRSTPSSTWAKRRMPGERIAQAREGWPAVRSTRRLSEVQTSEARAGIPRR